jgi:hypothetical protein
MSFGNDGSDFLFKGIFVFGITRKTAEKLGNYPVNQKERIEQRCRNVPKKPAEIDDVGSSQFYKSAGHPKVGDNNQQYNDRRNNNGSENDINREIGQITRHTKTVKEADQKETNAQESGKTDRCSDIFVLFDDHGKPFFGTAPPTKPF